MPRPGITENQLWAELHHTNIALGGGWIATRLLASGSRTNPRFQECSDRVIKAGDLVSFDELRERAWKIPSHYDDQKYGSITHGVGLIDEWPAISYGGSGRALQQGIENLSTFPLDDSLVA